MEDWEKKQIENERVDRIVSYVGIVLLFIALHLLEKVGC